MSRRTPVPTSEKPADGAAEEGNGRVRTAGRRLASSLE